MIRPMSAIPRLTEEIEDRFKSISLRKYFQQAMPDKKKVRFMMSLMKKKNKQNESGTNFE